MFRDLTYGLRMLRKSPGFTFLAILCLGLGIGVNAAIFSVLNFVLFRPLPVHDPDRLVVYSRGNTPLVSYPDYRDYRDRSRSFDGVAASNPTESSLDFDGITHNAGAEAVSANYQQVIGVRPYLGRWFEQEDEQSAVISYRVWQRWFDGDPHVLGKRIRSETQWYTVIGVAPPEFEGTYLPLSMDLWVPLKTWTKQYPGIDTPTGWMHDRAVARVFLFGRLKPGVDVSQAAAELNTIAEQIRREDSHVENAKSAIVLERVRGIPNPNSRRAAAPAGVLLLVVVGIVLLIACVNVGNLLMARCAAREREICMRLALGAARWRVIRQLLTESLLLAIGGGLAGLALGAWTSRLLELLLAQSPFESVRMNLSLDSRVMLFTGALSLVTVLFFGLAPAWRASRADVLASLKGSASGTERSGLRRVSLVAQVSLSLMLLLAAGLFLKLLVHYGDTSPGFAVEKRLYVNALVSPPEFTEQSSREFYAQALLRLGGVPGVKSAAITNILPLTPVGPGCVADYRGKTTGDSFAATSSSIDAGFLATMRISLLAGRNFTAADGPDSPRVALVNESLARSLWPGQSALGRRIELGCHDKTVLEVAGVVADTKVVSLGEAPRPHVYRPFLQTSDGMQTIIVETAGNSVSPETIRRTVAETNPAARIYEVKSLPEWVDKSYWALRWEVTVIGMFAALALLLAAVGLYGVVAYQVTLRTREIGVRIAIGARPGDVSGLILRQGMKLTLVGIVIGLGIFGVAGRAIAGLLTGVNPTDPATFAGVSMLWLAVAALACYLPARRAARVEPLEALRHE
jgi:predicted permease